MHVKEEIKQQILDQYIARTPKSKKLHRKGKVFVPGGDTRAIAHYDPYPFFAEKGKGCFLTDIDKNEYIDCVNNMTAMVHGHAHPKILKAICNQAAMGTNHSTPVEVQYKLAKHLCERIESIEKIRFCNSGTEATLFALRAARAYTGRDIIIKMDGGYHGAHDAVQANLSADVEAKGLPRTLLNPGIPACTADGVLIAPLNDLKTMEKILFQNKDQVAAIIIEPMFGSGGGAMATFDYLKGLRKLADTHGSLLIFDEVITLRFHEGGYQALARVKPDLTAIGKPIGGGIPVGAFGGRADVMAVFDHTKQDFVTHSGTFSGNALTMAAGLACMENFKQSEIDHINALGDKVRNGITRLFQKTGIKGSAGGYGSMVYIYFFNEPFDNGKDFARLIVPGLDFCKTLNLALLNQGVFCVAKGILVMVMSTPMDESIADDIINRFEKALTMTAQSGE